MKFFSNRIEFSMLVNLSKDYLNAMDIKAIGDIIKILTHIPKFIEKAERETFLGVNVTKNDLATRVSSAMPLSCT
jgi:hypothetical protein